MKTIQLKIGKNVINFNDEVEVISFMANRLAKKKTSTTTYNPKVVEAAKRMNADPNSGTRMTMQQFKEYLFNAQD